MAYFRGITDHPVDGMIMFLRDVFSLLQLNEKELEEFKMNYVGEEMDLGLDIRHAFALNLKQTEKFPVISVQRAGITFQNLSIGQRGDRINPDGSIGTYGSGEEHFKDLCQAGIQINCLDRVPLGAEKLANVVFESLLYFRQVYSDYGIWKVIPNTIGANQQIKADSDEDITNTPILTSVYFTIQTTLFHSGPKFEHFLLEIRNKRTGKILHVTDP